MGRYDADISHAKEMLATAETELQEAARSMAGAAPHVRDFVLG